MGEQPSRIRVEREGAVATVWLARPEKRNAFDDEMAKELEAAFEGLEGQDDLRAVILAGEGKHFCAGGDLAWMRRVADYTHEENLEDARGFQDAYERIDHFPRPVIGRIQGAALGGGAGLIAVCDVAICSSEATIGFPEVRLGLVPGVISPYVMRKIGESHTRHLFVTGERFNADEAFRLGLVHKVVGGDEAALDAAVQATVDQILKVSPEGAERAKGLVHSLSGKSGEGARRAARKAIADARASDDGREGTAAFLEKRKPRWLS